MSDGSDLQAQRDVQRLREQVQKLTEENERLTKHLRIHCTYDYISEACHRPGLCLDCDYSHWSDKRLLQEVKEDRRLPAAPSHKGEQ